MKQMQVLMTGLSPSREVSEGAALSSHFLTDVCPAPWLSAMRGMKGPQEPCPPLHRPREVQGVTWRLRGGLSQTQSSGRQVLVWEATPEREGAKQAALGPNCGCHTFSLVKWK